MTRLDLIVWKPGDDGQPGPIVGFVNPLTGEALDAAEPANVVAWVDAYHAFVLTVGAPALAAALDLLNAHLDYLGVAKTQIEDDAGRVFEVSGETAAAADGAVVVESAEALHDDLAVLVERGDLAASAAAAAVKVTTTTTYKADLRRVKSLAARADVVGETVRDHLTASGRDRKTPSVKRIA